MSGLRYLRMLFKKWGGSQLYVSIAPEGLEGGESRPAPLVLAATCSAVLPTCSCDAESERV
eukprot:3533635-Rhodomonas_salina.1